MAAPLAYEQPTINKAWEAFVAHVPTMLLIWIATAVLAGLGLAVAWLFVLFGVGLSAGSGSGDLAVSAASALGQLAQVWDYPNSVDRCQGSTRVSVRVLMACCS